MVKSYNIIMKYLKEIKQKKPIFKKIFVPVSISGSKFVSYSSLINKTAGTTHYDVLKLEDTSSVFGNLRFSSPVSPVRFLYNNLNIYNFENFTDNYLNVFNVKFYNDTDLLEQKTYQSENLWGFRQKKYKRLKKFAFTPRSTFNNFNFAKTEERVADSQRILVNNATIHNLVKEQDSYDQCLVSDYMSNKQCSSAYNSKNIFNEVVPEKPAVKPVVEKKAEAFDYYKAIRNNKHRSELIPVTIARRLLRTKRTLVLPAHTNITVVTNSYDVVHSWFIPGLGIKLDCVPGRSTHHTFYIDNVGFYYGQCAEICGRYHHHMPIRICALPFEQFLAWWQKKGLPRLNRLNTHGSKNLKDKYYNSIGSSTLADVQNNVAKYTRYKYVW